MKITVIENGPIMIDTQEEVSISEGGATEQKAGPLFLCRCGQSQNKPFCDGAHVAAGFEAP